MFLREIHLIRGLRYWDEKKCNDVIEELKQEAKIYANVKVILKILENAYFQLGRNHDYKIKYY